MKWNLFKVYFIHCTTKLWVHRRYIVIITQIYTNAGFNFIYISVAIKDFLYKILTRPWTLQTIRKTWDNDIGVTVIWLRVDQMITKIFNYFVPVFAFKFTDTTLQVNQIHARTHNRDKLFWRVKPIKAATPSFFTL